MDGCGPLAGIIIERWGYRKTCIVGALLSSGGMALAAFSTQLWMLYLTYGLVLGFGNSLAFFAPLVLMNRWFRKNLALSHALANAAASLLSLAFGPTAEPIFEHVGRRNAMLALAGLMLVLLLAASSVLTLPPPLLDEPSGTSEEGAADAGAAADTAAAETSTAADTAAAQPTAAADTEASAARRTSTASEWFGRLGGSGGASGARWGSAGGGLGGGSGGGSGGSPFRRALSRRSVRLLCLLTFTCEQRLSIHHRCLPPPCHKPHHVSPSAPPSAPPSCATICATACG
jgi:MFS family permease